MRQKANEIETPKGLVRIRPELLAAKLAAIRNHEDPQLLKALTERPRLVEMLWFIQFVSMQPGGLLKFCEDMIEQLPSRFGTATMRAAHGDALSLEAKLKIYGEFPSHWRVFEPLDEQGENLVELMLREADRRTTSEERALLSKQTKAWGLESFRKACFDAARDILPGFLGDLCTDKDKGFSPGHVYGMGTDGEPASRSETWFIDDPIGAVLQMMEIHAAQVQKRLAMTEVATLIFDRLDYALAEKVMVRIEGGSRFGKTESLSAWVEMRPGLARLVRVPSDNSMASLFKRIGEALGIDCSYGSNPARLKERVEYVIQHSGLFLVLDEGHFLAPMNFSASTPPHRLNWVRTEIVDRGLPLAIAVTPQAFKGAIDRYVKKTRYDMTQFFGRDFLPCVLPEVLSEADMIAVARVHFPQMSENALGYIANEARLSQNYLQAVEAIARRTRFLASKRGGQVRVKDIQTAVSEVLSRNPISAEQSAGADENQAPTRASKSGAERLVKEPLSAVAGGAQPGRLSTESGDVLDSHSLRGAGLERVSAELVSADS